MERPGTGAKVVRKARRPVRQWVWWCWGDNLRGRRVALGPFTTEAEAHEQGFTAYPGSFVPYCLDTRNLEKAKQKLKAKDLEDGRQIDDAMRRASHLP